MESCNLSFTPFLIVGFLRSRVACLDSRDHVSAKENRQFMNGAISALELDVKEQVIRETVDFHRQLQSTILSLQSSDESGTDALLVIVNEEMESSMGDSEAQEISKLKPL